MEQGKLKQGMRQQKKRSLGQGMVEYIIIVAVVALGSIAVYTAFGDVLRGQVATAAETLEGEVTGKGRESAKDASQRSVKEDSLKKTMGNYEKGAGE
ncbi:integral membrane protein [Betaproteobacteria bacterium]|nr:integral membrane protein [Betaproteobacteria bacterium]